MPFFEEWDKMGNILRVLMQHKVLFSELSSLAEEEIANLSQELPSPLRDVLVRIAIVLEEFPSVERQKEGIEPDQLGLFEGIGAEDLMNYHVPRIVLWLGNIWEMCNGDQDAYLEEVRVTFLHELGHYVGFDEAELLERDVC